MDLNDLRDTVTKNYDAHAPVMFDFHLRPDGLYIHGTITPIKYSNGKRSEFLHYRHIVPWRELMDYKVSMLDVNIGLIAHKLKTKLKEEVNNVK